MSTERLAVAANTALVKIARRLEESERWLRTIADHVPAQIVYLDATRTFRFCNRPFETAHALEPGAAIGRTVRDVLGESWGRLMAPHLEAALAGASPVFDLDEPTANGTRCFRVSFVPDHAADGAIAGVHALLQDTTEDRRLEAELERLAQHDPLTGLPNRMLFEDRLSLAQARAAREGRPMALLYLDLDRFKSINDSLGHGAGDEVLREFARRLQSSVRRTDTVARLGGDEFAVILEGLNDPAEAEQVAAKILSDMRAPVTAAGQRLDVHTSIGIAVGDGRTMDSAALVASADTALYAAKRSGRDAYRASTLEGNPLQALSNRLPVDRRDHAGRARVKGVERQNQLSDWRSDHR